MEAWSRVDNGDETMAKTGRATSRHNVGLAVVVEAESTQAMPWVPPVRRTAQSRRFSKRGGIPMAGGEEG